MTRIRSAPLTPEDHARQAAAIDDYDRARAKRRMKHRLARLVYLAACLIVGVRMFYVLGAS